MTPPKSGPGTQPRPRPMILFGLLTLMTFAGPLAIIVVGQGGERPTWPPDRPVEWWVFYGVTIGYVVLLLACLIDAGLTLRRQRRESSSATDEDDRRTEGEP